MPNISSFGTQTDNAVVQGTVTDRQMIIPEVPPQGLMSVGPRVTPNFVKPREWSAQTTYHFFDAVRDTAGNAYVATKPVVPAGTPLTNEDYWFLWADPDTRFDDLNETVKTFNQRITQNASAIATKAPTNHASEETIYGIGNELNYGHVKLATDETPMTSDSNAGIAATPKMIHDSQSFQGAKRNILMLGNSYTTGYDDYTKPYGIMNQVGFAFENVYATGASACGFVQYAEHPFDFFTILKSWFNSNTSIAPSITDIAINSAVGDSFCLNALPSYGTDANNTFNKIMEFCKTNFPNLKRLKIFLCDSLYKTARHSSALNTDVGLLDLINTDRFFANIETFNNTAANYYQFEVAYCGWVGWGLLSTAYMNNPDNIHPTKNGYIKLSRNWLAAYNGNLTNALNKSFDTIRLTANDFAENTSIIIKYAVDCSGIIHALVSLNGITNNTTAKQPNNWVTVGKIPFLTSKGTSNYIVNLQPTVNFRINATGDVQLRASQIDTAAINRIDVYTPYTLGIF